MTTSFTRQFTWLHITDSVLFSLHDDLSNLTTEQKLAE